MNEHVCNFIESKVESYSSEERKRLVALVKSEIKLEEKRNDSEVQFYFSGLLNIILALGTLINGALQNIFASVINAKLSVVNTENAYTILSSVRESLENQGQVFLDIFSIVCAFSIFITILMYIWKVCKKSISEKN